MSFREIPVNKPALRVLYEHAGREAGIAVILQDFYGRMSRDILIGFFFDGKDVHAIAEKQKEFLLRAMGAIPSYTGKPPAEAHLELPPILPGHFDRRLKILEDTLKCYGLPDEDIRSWIGFENAFREGITR